MFMNVSTTIKTLVVTAIMTVAVPLAATAQTTDITRTSVFSRRVARIRLRLPSTARTAIFLHATSTQQDGQATAYIRLAELAHLSILTSTAHSSIPSWAHTRVLMWLRFVRRLSALTIRTTPA